MLDANPPHFSKAKSLMGGSRVTVTEILKRDYYSLQVMLDCLLQHNMILVIELQRDSKAAVGLKEVSSNY